MPDEKNCYALAKVSDVGADGGLAATTADGQTVTGKVRRGTRSSDRHPSRPARSLGSACSVPCPARAARLPTGCEPAALSQSGAARICSALAARGSCGLPAQLGARSAVSFRARSPASGGSGNSRFVWRVWGPSHARCLQWQMSRGRSSHVHLQDVCRCSHLRRHRHHSLPRSLPLHSCNPQPATRNPPPHTTPVMQPNRPTAAHPTSYPQSLALRKLPRAPLGGHWERVPGTGGCLAVQPGSPAGVPSRYGACCPGG